MTVIGVPKFGSGWSTEDSGGILATLKLHKLGWTIICRRTGTARTVHLNVILYSERL